VRVSTLIVPPIASDPYSALPGPFMTSIPPDCGTLISYSALWLKKPVERVGMPSSR